jgi:hypothetical protein
MRRWIMAGLLTALFLSLLSFFRPQLAKPWPDLVQAAVTVEQLPWNRAARPKPFASESDTAWVVPEGAPNLAITRRDAGWEVTAADEAAKALGDNAVSGPADLLWAGADRALVRWHGGA